MAFTYRCLQRNQILFSQPKNRVGLCFAEYEGGGYSMGLQWIDAHKSGLQADRIQT